MKHFRFFLLLGPLLLCLGGSHDAASVPKIPAKLCSSCGFGTKKENCAKCGKWVGSTNIPARLCSDCGFGAKKENCVKCGKWVGSTDIRAKLCSDCGFGAKKENCVKCGKWAP